MSNEPRIRTKLKKIPQFIIGPKDGEYRKLKIVLVAITLISISSAALVTATKALFTGKQEVPTHVVTGNLDFEFYRTKVEGQALTAEGYVDDYADNTKVNLTESGADAFDIDLLVPGSTYTATFNLKNVGTTAFESNISFINLECDNQYLLEQIVITTEFNAVTETYSLSEYATINLELGHLAVSEDLDFKVSLSLPSTADNKAQDSDVKFAIKLDAVQVLNK